MCIHCYHINYNFKVNIACSELLTWLITIQLLCFLNCISYPYSSCYCTYTIQIYIHTYIVCLHVCLCMYIYSHLWTCLHCIYSSEYWYIHCMHAMSQVIGHHSPSAWTRLSMPLMSSNLSSKENLKLAVWQIKIDNKGTYFYNL